MTETNAPLESGLPPVTGSSANEPRTVDAGQGWNWIAEAWGLFLKSPGVWIVDFLILLVLYLLLHLLPFLGHLASFVLWPVILGGLMLGCRALARGQKFEVGHVFAGFKTNTSQLVMLGIFNLVIFVVIAGIALVAMLVAGGGAVFAAVSVDSLMTALLSGALMLFALLGLLIVLLLSIPLVMALWFAPSLVVFRNASAADAMVLSFNACLKNIVPFFVYSVIALIPCVVLFVTVLGWLVLFPVLIASIYTSYRDVFADS
jgi:uncharacterized membrane protein